MTYPDTCPRPDKRPYPTKHEAKRTLRRMRGVKHRRKLNVYRCVCDFWHIGNRP